MSYIEPLFKITSITPVFYEQNEYQNKSCSLCGKKLSDRCIICQYETNKNYSSNCHVYHNKYNNIYTHEHCAQNSIQ